jgi:hypothetical protein
LPGLCDLQIFKSSSYKDLRLQVYVMKRSTEDRSNVSFLKGDYTCKVLMTGEDRRNTSVFCYEVNDERLEGSSELLVWHNSRNI